MTVSISLRTRNGHHHEVECHHLLQQMSETFMDILKGQNSWQDVFAQQIVSFPILKKVGFGDHNPIAWEVKQI